MLSSPIQDVLFLDIETAPIHAEYNDLEGIDKYLWDRSARYIDNDHSEDNHYQNAKSHAEFARIVCICVGKIGKDDNGEFLKLRCFYNEDEQKLLLEFNSFLLKLNNNTKLCAHNGKEFDFPFIGKRMLINGIELPSILNFTGKNPWEVPHIDTSELWRFGSVKQIATLEHLAHLFKIESIKNDFEGENSQKVYYKQNELQRIVDYCYNDVITIAQLLLRFNNQKTIRTENIYYV